MAVAGQAGVLLPAAGVQEHALAVVLVDGLDLFVAPLDGDSLQVDLDGDR